MEVYKIIVFSYVYSVLLFIELIELVNSIIDVYCFPFVNAMSKKTATFLEADLVFGM